MIAHSLTSGLRTSSSPTTSPTNARHTPRSASSAATASTAGSCRPHETARSGPSCRITAPTWPPSKPSKRANARLASDLSRPGIERPWNVAGSDGLDLLGRPQMISVRGGERVLLRLHRSQRYGLVFDSGHLTHRAPVAQLAASAVSRFWGVSWGVTLYQASCTRPSSSMRNADRWTPVNSMPFGSVTLPQTS